MALVEQDVAAGFVKEVRGGIVQAMDEAIYSPMEVAKAYPVEGVNKDRVKSAVPANSVENNIERADDGAYDGTVDGVSDGAIDSSM